MEATTCLNWRDHLAVHPAAEAFPLLSEKELNELAGDIKRNDLKTDLVLWRSDDKTEPVLLDGRNRLDALAILDRLALDGAELCIKRADGSLRQVKSFKTANGGDPEKLAYSLNLHRRHLSPEQKRELIARLLQEKPETSDRQIAKAAKASPTFVGKVRAEKEAAGEVSTVDTRIDAKGVKQPAKKKVAPAKPKPPSSQVQRELDAKQAHIDELETAHERDKDLAEQLQLAKIEIIGLKSEVEELKDERDRLRARVAELENLLASCAPVQTEKPKRGRQKGSKNKPKPPADNITASGNGAAL